MALDPDDALDEIARLDAGLRITPYYGERSLFYNPAGAAPLGIIVCSVKDHDGPRDRASQLDRPGVWRFAFGMTRSSYEERFGMRPARPPRGGVVELAGYDPSKIGRLTPHPVYAWMAWAQILSPTRAQFDALRPMLAESIESARIKWARTR
jgi:Family of unknown function (DUF6194)